MSRLGACAVVATLWAAGSAQAGSPLEEDPRFVAAKASYEDVEYAEAYQAFEELGLDDERSASERALALVWAGLCQGQLSQELSARDKFRRAVSLHVDVEAPAGMPPRVLEWLEEARADELQRRASELDHQATEVPPALAPAPDEPPPEHPDPAPADIVEELPSGANSSHDGGARGPPESELNLAPWLYGSAALAGVVAVVASASAAAALAGGSWLALSSDDRSIPLAEAQLRMGTGVSGIVVAVIVGALAAGSALTTAGLLVAAAVFE